MSKGQTISLAVFVTVNSLLLGTAFAVNRRMMRNKQKQLEEVLGGDGLAKAGVVAMSTGSVILGLYFFNKFAP